MNSPALGLLLDVDGPIASPVTRTVAIDSIAHDLVALANAGNPVIFNTGRSDAFIRDVVLDAMLGAMERARPGRKQCVSLLDFISALYSVREHPDTT